MPYLCVNFLSGLHGRWLGLEVRELDVSPRYWFLIMDRSVNIFYFSYFSCVISPQLFIILWVRRSSWAVFLLYMGLLTWVHSDHDWDGELKKTLLTGSVLLHHAFLSSQVVLSFGSLAWTSLWHGVWLPQRTWQWKLRGFPRAMSGTGKLFLPLYSFGRPSQRPRSPARSGGKEIDSTFWWEEQCAYTEERRNCWWLSLEIFFYYSSFIY